MKGSVRDGRPLVGETELAQMLMAMNGLCNLEEPRLAQVVALKLQDMVTHHTKRRKAY